MKVAPNRRARLSCFFYAKGGRVRSTESRGRVRSTEGKQMEERSIAAEAIPNLDEIEIEQVGQVI